MAKEIERKFLVSPRYFFTEDAGHIITQGYFPNENPSIRIRISSSKDSTQAVLTIKSKHTEITRFEFEYPIPVSDAHEMLDMYCGNRLIEKTRYKLKFGSKVWEVDVYGGRNTGLIVAEVELEEEKEQIEIPLWVYKEVTGSPQYTNHSIALENERIWKLSDKSSQ